MKIQLFILLNIALLSPIPAIADKQDNRMLLNSFHDYGITQCDTFILENNVLEGNWHFFINKHSGGLDGPSTEVSVVTITGEKGDTTKRDYSFVETAKKCFVHKRTTITFIGECSSKINKDFWHVSTPMPRKDYTTYKNKHGLEMQAKDIYNKNFKACVLEYSVREKGQHG